MNKYHEPPTRGQGLEALVGLGFRGLRFRAQGFGLRVSWLWLLGFGRVTLNPKPETLKGHKQPRRVCGSSAEHHRREAHREGFPDARV